MPAPDVHAAAYYNHAKCYRLAADELSALREEKPEDARRLLRDPVYFLYFHTVELALKAFLRVHGLQIAGTERFGHKLTELYAECRDLGLLVGRDEFAATNIVGLLSQGNIYQAFRYFTTASVAVPDLGWTKSVVDELMKSVESTIRAIDPEAFTPGPAAKATMTIGPIKDKTQ